MSHPTRPLISTIKQAREYCKTLGIRLTWSTEYQEYRVNFFGASEATSYYTDDREDAIRNAEVMTQWKQDELDSIGIQAS
jgi:hypothetical protein